MSDKAKVWLVVIAILLVIGYMARSKSSSSHNSSSTCEQLWTANKDTSLVGYTHSSYIKFCNDMGHQLQQFQQDHGTTP